MRRVGWNSEARLATVGVRWAECARHVSGPQPALRARHVFRCACVCYLITVVKLFVSSLGFSVWFVSDLIVCGRFVVCVRVRACGYNSCVRYSVDSYAAERYAIILQLLRN